MVGGGSWNAAKKLIAQTCGSFSWNTNSNSNCRRNPTQDDVSVSASVSVSANNAAATAHHRKKHNICAICLDPLNYNNSASAAGGTTPPAIFTAQCSHAFHFSCISSNVRHGSVTCPVCRAHWTHLPRNSNSLRSDPILQILDDSIATFRIHRRSFLLSARYDDDDPLHPHPHHHTTTTTSSYHRLRISLLPTSSDNSPRRVRAYLCVRLDHQPANDLVLVATPNGPHLRLMKQAMALVILSLRPEDRLSIVTYSSALAASRLFPLKRMTSYGKRRALQVIDRLFYTGSADPTVGLKKGIKVLNDRVYRNPESHVLHLSDTPTWSYNHFNVNLEAAVKIHRFHIGFGFGMRDFENFLAGMLGGAITDIQLKMKEDRRVIKLGELRGGEERRVPLLLRRSSQYCVEYSYVDNGGGTEGCSGNKTGEMLVGIDDDDDLEMNQMMMMMSGGRRSSAESWEYHDTFMARRWAKHLHGNR